MESDNEAASQFMEEEKDGLCDYCTFTEGLFVEIVEAWLDKNGASLLSEVMDKKKKPAMKRQPAKTSLNTGGYRDKDDHFYDADFKTDIGWRK